MKQQYTATELLQRMPKNYRQLSYSLYTEMMSNILTEKPDGMNEEDFKTYQAYSMISILLNISIEELDKLPYATIIPLINSLAFLDQEIVLTHTNIKTKDVESLTFKEFQSLMQLLPNQFNYMADILSIIIEDTTIDINSLSVWEVTQIMGKLRKSSLQSLRRSQSSLAWKIILMKMKQTMKKVVNIISLKKQTESLVQDTV